jgi:hypothetical protein
VHESPLGLDAGRGRRPEDCQELQYQQSASAAFPGGPLETPEQGWWLPPHYRPLGLQRREEPAKGRATARQLSHHQPPPAEQWLQPSAHHQVALVLRPL